jgi:phosphoglycolate phosphatase
MAELLDVLDTHSVPWGIVTNKPGWLTRPLVEALDLTTRAACLVTGDCLPRRKPDPSPVLRACHDLGLPPSDCVLVGDAQRDVEAGQRAGTLTLVALFGYINAEDRVASWGADGLIGHPRDILNWLVPSRETAAPEPAASA